MSESDQAVAPTRSALAVVLIYAAFAALWILLSDRILELLLSEAAHIVQASMIKGVAFVVVTSLLLYILVQRLLGQLLAASRRESHMQQEKLHALQLIETISESVDDAIFAKDLAGRYILFNRAASNAVGKPVEQVLGCDDREIFPPEQADIVSGSDRAVLARNSTLTTEERLCTPNGERTFLVTKGPLRKGDGRVTGVFGIARDITARKESEALIERLAYFDSLTELPNRVLLLDRLGQAMLASERSREHGMLLLLDMDHLKVLNDSQGYAAGDQLLREIARRLKDCVRAADSVARLSGDEFAVLVEGLGEQEERAVTQAERIAEKIHASLSRSYDLDIAAGTYHVTPSIGVSVFRGQGDTVDGLLKKAEIALHKAKADGRNALRFFSPAMQAIVDSRASIERGMLEALANNEFLLFFQPQVDQEGQVVGAEALIRWFRPDGSIVSPAEFIPVAEETGLIIPIGTWVLETGCAQLKDWQLQAATRHLTLAINVSARQFHQPDFVEKVRVCVERSGIDPSRLKLELTESVVVGDIEVTAARMDQIKALGVRFSLDDFGTGYSSLSYLKRLPFDQLKIDQSFVRDMVADATSASIVRAILAMSESLGLEVVAEGVEWIAQKDYLQSSGCRIYQGFLFGRPAPIGEWSSRWHGASNAYPEP